MHVQLYNDNVKILLHLKFGWLKYCVRYLIQNSPAVKKVCSHQEGHCEKRYEIQGGGQEMAVMVG